MSNLSLAWKLLRVSREVTIFQPGIAMREISIGHAPMSKDGNIKATAIVALHYLSNLPMDAFARFVENSFAMLMQSRMDTMPKDQRLCLKYTLIFFKTAPLLLTQPSTGCISVSLWQHEEGLCSSCSAENLAEVLIKS